MGLHHAVRSPNCRTIHAVATPNCQNAEANRNLVGWSARELRRFAPILDRTRAGRKYLAGNPATLTDYSMIHLEALEDVTPFDRTPYSHLNDHFGRMREQPRWARTASSSRAAVGRRPTPNEGAVQ